MASSQGIPWLRIGAESVAIVGSILLAFAIDAWWDDRQERRLEGQYLEAIVDEIDRNLEATAGNRAILERSYSDLLRARDLLMSGAHTDSASDFVMSLNRGLIYGVPSISTAVFDDLSNSGRITLIEDMGVRRQIMDLYAVIEAELLRFYGRNDAVALDHLVNAYTPPGIIRQVAAQFTFDESGVPLDDMRDAAQALGAEESLTKALNEEIRRRERERAFLDAHEARLRRARTDFLDVVVKGGEKSFPKIAGHN